MTEWELWKYAKGAWDNFDRDYITSLLRSFRHRVALCVEMEGHSINPIY